ncbi:MAG: GntR family transcriptional regulator [Gulosibacter sp.]|uniref:GntR family transcriptional regulator n=1 Tax=Gulosibacter sp. TaxID=2817531 RepID=UPI003F8EA712
MRVGDLVSTGQLAAHERIPSVRQLAKDLDVAPGTVAKAYKALGTRVSEGAGAVQRSVLTAARELVDNSVRSGTSLDETVRILRAIWPEEESTR